MDVLIDGFLFFFFFFSSHPKLKNKEMNTTLFAFRATSPVGTVIPPHVIELSPAAVARIGCAPGSVVAARATSAPREEKVEEGRREASLVWFPFTVRFGRSSSQDEARFHSEVLVSMLTSSIIEVSAILPAHLWHSPDGSRPAHPIVPWCWRMDLTPLPSTSSSSSPPPVLSRLSAVVSNDYRDVVLSVGSCLAVRIGGVESLLCVKGFSAYNDDTARSMHTVGAPSWFRVPPNVELTVDYARESDATDEWGAASPPCVLSDDLRQRITSMFRSDGSGRQDVRHTLLFGGRGAGKSTQLAAIAAFAQRDIPNLVVEKADPVNNFDSVGKHRTRLSAVKRMTQTVSRHQQRLGHQRRLLILWDDIDNLFDSVPSGLVLSDQSGGVSVAAALKQCLESVPPEWAIIATCSTTSGLPDEIASSFFSPLPVTSPASPSERCAALTWSMRQLEHRVSSLEIEAFTASSCFGYTPRDFSTLVHSASARCFERCGRADFELRDLEKAARSLRPSALKGFDLVVPTTTFDDIGGNDDAKRVLKDCISWNLGQDKALFAALNMRPPRGVLLFGPPGCSKTMLAKAVANQGHMHFISVKGPEVFSKWVGDSEKAVRDIFSKARAAAPCVVFVDELDGMCGKRGKGGVADRVITQLLTELDGMPSQSAGPAATDRPVIFLAATNRPDHIDAALLRPGRIDRKVYIGLPLADERAAIAQLHLRRMPCAPDVTSQRVAEATDGFSGAEVVALCKEAAIQAIKESMEAAAVRWDHFEAARAVVVPRTKPDDLDRYLRWARSGRFDA